MTALTDIQSFALPTLKMKTIDRRTTISTAAFAFAALLNTGAVGADPAPVFYSLYADHTALNKVSQTAGPALLEQQELATSNTLLYIDS
jgi:hypothetical protein